jgi:hypothetical protein
MATEVENPKPLTDALRRRALELRLEGLSFPAIGRKLSITHPWAATQQQLAKLPDGERKKMEERLAKIGVRRESKPTTKAAKTSGKKSDAVHAVPKPKDKKVARPKGAPRRIKNGADAAAMSDAQLAANIDAKREQSPLNMTRAEREKLVKAGKLPTADLAQLQKLEAQKAENGEVNPAGVAASTAS